MLGQALAQLGGQIGDLMRQMLEGNQLSTDQIQAAADRAGARGARDPRQSRWRSRRTLEELGWRELAEQLEALLDLLTQMGMSGQAREQLRGEMMGNIRSLAKQVDRQVNAGIARGMAERVGEAKPTPHILDLPFEHIGQRQEEDLHQEVQRLAARLRTRAALRQKRGKGRALDVKGTLRANVRYGGLPFQVVHKERRKKAKFTIICDISTSMRPVASFLLMLIYQLQDQVSRTRAFAFIDHLEEISHDFNAMRPERAIPRVLRRLPPGHYNTDLGSSLAQLVERHGDAVDRRTTLIFCGDARNNFNDPRVDLLRMLAARASKTVWLNPEHPARWRHGDSDMYRYQPHVDALFQVANLRQLSHAVDRLFN
jgi:uncharacterized protein with von Willebrand factor type A (vWA) domain